METTIRVPEILLKCAVVVRVHVDREPDSDTICTTVAIEYDDTSVLVRCDDEWDRGDWTTGGNERSDAHKALWAYIAGNNVRTRRQRFQQPRAAGRVPLRHNWQPKVQGKPWECSQCDVKYYVENPTPWELECEGVKAAQPPMDLDHMRSKSEELFTVCLNCVLWGPCQREHKCLRSRG